MTIPRIAISLILSAISLFAQISGENPNGVRAEIDGVVLERDDNRPVVDVEVDVSVDGSVVGTVRTDASGAFHFQGDKLGEYSLSVNIGGYISIRGGPAFRRPSSEAEVILDSDHSKRKVQIFLPRKGELFGRVIDEESGKPLAKFPIQVARLFYQRGIRVIWPADKAYTDSEGRFRVTRKEPGRYVAVVLPQSTKFLRKFSEEDAKVVDQDYERSYWPGGGGLDLTDGVLLPPGGIGDLGVIKARKIPFYRVRVSMPVPCESDKNIPIIGGLIADQSGMPIVGQVACGMGFLISSLQPGQYSFDLLAIREHRVQTFAFDVMDRNIDVTSSVVDRVEVEGDIIVADGASLPRSYRPQARVWSLTSFPLIQSISPNAKGKFRLENIAAGPQWLDFPGADKHYYIKEARYNGVVISDNTFNVMGAGSLQIIIDDKPAVVTGTVLDQDHPVNQPWVVLFRSPIPSDCARMRPKEKFGGKDGKFQFEGLAPGEYRILAVSRADRDKLDEPGVLYRLLPAAAKVVLDPRGFQNLSLKLTDPAR